MEVGTLETWLWDAACEIRGPLDAPKFKDYILPLVFLKRLSDVFDDEVARLGDEFGNAATKPHTWSRSGNGPNKSPEPSKNGNSPPRRLWRS